ncbi:MULTISPECIES: META domain-containing protein [unclassified Arthrobacter]|uniref:META domain-containing protein n=1 Tax=unclassified Arthrobacter TaxID=235627 RepID=UPI001D159513|nr:MULTISPECIES: META domain-containing protein [unclassified Arthrobacter]MCC3278366.1 META domain-containing protein [Arthrobacter sp. zg-Y40]MCC9176738.1 META domain-containing protein [Arthrobacter sp. zg-Y750]WIB05866.1 META domain-containing protein [Arthrobacter sp. zg-Y20]
MAVTRRLPVPALLSVLLLPALLPLAACGDVAGSTSPDDGGATPDADVTGAWGDTANTEAPSLDFDPNGRVSGTDGCNRLMGHWSVKGNRVTMQDMASTMMLCHGIDTWLSGGAAADVDGDTLRIYDQAGTEIGVLERPKPGS